MKSLPPLRIVVLLATLSSAAGSASATLTPLSSPAQITDGLTLNFDGYPDRTIANSLFATEGIIFTRDDSASIFLLDFNAAGRVTTSPNNVIATISGSGVSIWATHLNVLSSTPLSAAGAYFGNDQADPDFTRIRMSVFGVSNNLLGSVDVAANNNTSVDQFIGLQSDVPFSRIRFDNLTSSGNQSLLYSVILDDFVFATATVPEPANLTLVGFGLALLGLSTSRRRPGRSSAGGLGSL